MSPTASWGGTERTEPGSSQPCTAAGRDQLTQVKTKEIPVRHQEKCFATRVVRQVPQGGCAVSIPGEGPEQPAQNWPCSGRGLDPVASSQPLQPKLSCDSAHSMSHEGREMNRNKQLTSQLGILRKIKGPLPEKHNGKKNLNNSSKSPG